MPEQPQNPQQPEEVNLSGATPKPQQPAPGQDPAFPDLSAHYGDIQSAYGPSTNDAELLDAVITAPEEKLIPWEFAKIPSLGIYYQWPVQGVEVRAMGQGVDKILANQRLAQSGQSIDYIFRECVRFQDQAFDPLELLVGDRVFLLYYLRGITHGNTYEFALTCMRPDCQQMSTHVYDLNELASTIKWADPNMGPEPFRVTLPYLSNTLGREFWVGLRFLRGRDTNNMMTLFRARRKMVSPAIRAGGRRGVPQQQQLRAPTISDTLDENLALVIDNAMGVKDRGKVQALVSRLHATDTATIREWLRDNTPGMETTIRLNCPECGQEMTVELPLTESFFRPTQK